MEIDVERARLSFLASIAATIRRQTGLEWSPRGYRLRRIRMTRMEQRLRAPLVDLHIVRIDPKEATAVVEWEDARGRIRQAVVPQIAIARHARRRRGAALIAALLSVLIWITVGEVLAGTREPLHVGACARDR
jgi:hypothetical protein